MDISSLDKEIIKMYQAGESTYTIAAALDTYPNKVKRVLAKHGVKLRDKRTAQKNAAENGRYMHPTAGKKHSDEVKARISENVHKSWAELSEEDKEITRLQAKQNWDNLTDSQKEELQNKARKAIRKAADEGSKLERFLLNYLIESGREALHHSTHKVAVEQMEIDIFLPADRIAVEIDGPSHYEPIWGEDSLKRNKVADNKKNGLLLANGYHVVRIRDKSKKLTRKIERRAVECIEDAIKGLAKEKQPKLIYVDIE
jgi:very-short-patch-repair endonuclease